MSQTKAQLLDGKSATIQFTGGSASAPSVSFTGDTNTGIYSPGADQVAISTGGSGRLFVDASGNVKVGSTDNSNAGSQYITVGAPGSVIGGLQLWSTTTGQSYVQFGDGTASADHYRGYMAYLHANDALTFGTASSERLRITSAGLVGIGTSSPVSVTGFGTLLTVANNAGGGIVLQDANTTLGYRNKYIASVDGEIHFGKCADDGTSPTTQVLLDHTGRLGIGTTSPSSRLHVLNPSAGPEVSTIERDNSGVFLKLYRNAGSGNQGGLIGADSAGTYFAGGTTTAEMLYIDSGNSVMQFFTSGSERVRIDSSGRVGIGTTSPGELLHVVNPSTTAEIRLSGGTTAASYSQIGFHGGSTRNAEIAANSAFLTLTHQNSGVVRVETGGSEALRVDSSRRLLVGTSSARSQQGVTPRLQVESTDYDGLSLVVNGGTTANRGPVLLLGRSRGTTLNSSTAVASGDRLGLIAFQGADGTDIENAAAFIIVEVDGTPGVDDMPGRLVFATTADGASFPTERMRITNGGTMLQGNTSDLTGVLGTGLKVKSNEVGTSYSAGALCLQGTGGDFYAIKFADSDMGVLSVTSGSVDYIQIGGSTSTATFYSNGLVQLPNVGTTASAANVFMDSTASNQLARSTSSLRYKTDIEDLDTDRADAALSLRPVWYRSKATADRKDWSHYGLIAEEVAEIEPRLVNWAYLEDDYITVTNEYGIENKELKPSAKLVPDGVQYERLPVLLLSIIQRQEKRIKQLEAEVVTIKAQLS